MASVCARTASTWSAIQAPFKPLAASCSAYSRFAVLRSQRRKSALPFQFLAARNGAGPLPGGISAHAAEAALPLSEDGVIELPGYLQMGAQPFRLAGCHLEREFQEKGRRSFARGFLLICAGLPFPGHGMKASFLNLRTFVL